MSEKHKNVVGAAGKVDLRNVFLDNETDCALDEWRAKEKRVSHKKLKKGDAAVALIKKGLKAEGIL